MKTTKLLQIMISASLALAAVLMLLGVLSTQTHPVYAAESQSVTSLKPKTILQASDTLSISNITGATYDPERGEIVIFGIADPNLPLLDYAYLQENLVIALRAYYNPAGPDVPGVSIEGTLDPLDVIYFGGVANTHFGQIAFESDRLLKVYTMGKDNLTGLPVTSTVPGYMSYPDRMNLQTETSTVSTLIRYFVTPTLTIEPVVSPPTIIFSQTQKMIDWAYMSANTSAATTNAAQGFVDNFNQHYLEYAAERWTNYGDTTFYEMIQLSKITAIARWASEQGLELGLPGLNFPWLSHYPINDIPTPTHTPGITVTWVQTITNVQYELSLRGGVYSIGEINWIPPTIAGQTVASEIQTVIREPVPPAMSKKVRPILVRPMEPSFPYHETQGELVAYSIPLADNAVGNGDFEDGPGSGPWNQISTFEIIANTPRQGFYAAWLGGYANAQDSLYQTITIPADATMARLTYWRAISTDETSHPYDFFSSYLSDIYGTQLTSFDVIDDGDADGYWHEVSFDVSNYAGQTVQLWFVATNDALNDTSFFVDDVSLDYLDLTPPAVTNITHTPEIVPLSGNVEMCFNFREPMSTMVTPTVTLHLQGNLSYLSMIPKAGVGYIRGYLASNTTLWCGTYTFTPAMMGGTYWVDISSAQDIAGNVMFPDTDAHTIAFDPTQPQIQQKAPASETKGVSVDAGIVITFSESISTTTFAYTVSPNPGGWVASWNGSHTVVTLNHTFFSPGIMYTVTILQAKDLANNVLDSAPVSWSFTTAASDTTAPVIQTVLPANGAVGVSVNAGIVITFSESISTTTFAYSVSPNPGGWVASWNGSHTVVTLSHASFAAGTTHTVNVTQAKDMAGNALGSAPVSWSFTTVISDTTAPTILMVSPANGTNDVSVGAGIVITFSESISTTTFAYSVSPNPGGWVASWNGSHTVVTLSHTSFAAGTVYTITILQAKDLAGNDLVGTLVNWSFTTSLIDTTHKVYLPMMVKSFTGTVATGMP
jgi:hypothetical protein